MTYDLPQTTLQLQHPGQTRQTIREILQILWDTEDLHRELTQRMQVLLEESQLAHVANVSTSIPPRG